MKLTDREQLIIDFIKDNKIDLEELIDLIIKANGYIGVGLISLEDYMVEAVKQAVRKHHDTDKSLDKIMNG
tara:strand:+ start:273 stop:485 length:213 start_codon:yes stop_codon:yes gene_type:complete